MLCGLLCFVAVLVSGSSLPRRISPCCATFFPYGVRAISIFYQFTQFLGTASDGEVERMLSSSLPSISLPTPQSILRASPMPPSCLPSSSAPPPLPSGSPGGRPVSAKPIGKQRPKMYFLASSPSPMSKHSHGSRKNVAGP